MREKILVLFVGLTLWSPSASALECMIWSDIDGRVTKGSVQNCVQSLQERIERLEKEKAALSSSLDSLERRVRHLEIMRK